MTQDGTAGDVSVSGGQGVQAGSGNTQVNNWPTRTPLTPAILAARNPDAGAARIRQLSHDEAVDLFADTSSQVLAPKLKVLLRSADQQRVVAILADLDASKAAELISPLATDFPWLSALPRAAEAIAQRGGELQWHHEAETGRLERAARSPEGTEGYFRQYAQGRIYWYWHDDAEKTYAVSGAIAEFHLFCGGTKGELGFPRQDGGHWSSGRAYGSGQPFEGGYLFSSSHGTYSLSPEFWSAWPRWLGFPLSGVETHDGFTSQRFEEGVLYSSQAGTFAVRSEVARWVDDGWLPISAEEEIVGTGRTVLVQRFKDDYQVAATYSSFDTGPHLVAGNVLALYEELGGPDSILGLPAAAEELADGEDFPYIQRFEHGSIYGRPGIYQATAVPADTIALIGDRLGWPESQEKAVDGSDDETIQYFEKGVVTLRDGKREIWLRPQPSEP